MAAFEVLTGLPAYGPMAKSFPASGFGAHSQGFVVEFKSDKFGSWIGNFQLGPTTFSAAYDHPDAKRIVVVAGGNVYVVDPETQMAEESGGMVLSATRLKEKNALLFEDCTNISLISAHGSWQTKRLSWDGIRNLTISGEFVSGEAWRYDETWHEFSVSLIDGSHLGGAYDDTEFTPIRPPWWQFWRSHA